MSSTIKTQKIDSTDWDNNNKNTMILSDEQLTKKLVKLFQL